MTTSEDRPKKTGWRRRAGVAVILLAALVATSPQLIRGNSCGHDFNFHLVSWLDAQASWRHGILYPHWSPSPNFGAGEPRFVFYPPLTWMLGATLGLATPWKAIMVVYKFWKCVPIVITYLFLAGTGLATRALARQTLDNEAATLAGCAALFSGYTLFTAYERSAFGELAGGIWIPLLLLFMLRDRETNAPLLHRAFDGSTAPLAVVLAGAWLSNDPLGVMASYLLAAVALVWAVLLRSWAPLVRAMAATLLALGLASFYLVPAAVEQRWVQIRQATDDPGALIENSWMFARHADPALDLHDLELLKVSVIGLTMIAVTAGGIFVAWRRGRLRRIGKCWIPLALIPLAVLLLQFPISLPVWNAVPKLRFLQFPWRWLVVVEAPMAIFFASAVWTTRRSLRWVVIALCAAFFVGVAGFTGFALLQHCDYEDSVAGTLDVYRYHLGSEGSDEYAPPRADNSQVATGLPDACLTSDPLLQLGHGEEGTTPAYQPGICDSTFSWNSDIGERNAEHLQLSAAMPRAGYLILKLRTYPAWKLTVNGQQPGPLSHREDGLTVLPVPEGALQITADWTTTSDVIIGRWLSISALAFFGWVWWFERKLRTRRFVPSKARSAEPRLS